VDPVRVRVILFSFLPPLSVPGFRSAEERQTDGGGGGGETPHLWVSLLPRKPCLAYITPVSNDITCQGCPLTTRYSLQWPAWTQRQAAVSVCVCVCVWERGGVSKITMTKNHWRRNKGMFISAVNPHRPSVISLTQEGLYLFLFTVNAAC